MKYLFIIFALVSGTIVISLFLFPDPEQMRDEEVAVSINGHNISEKTLSDAGKKYGYHDDSTQIYESVITRELLIQEAQRQNIDQEESFRKAIKDFYENSLVKILLERKNKEIAVSVSDQEVSDYLRFYGKNVTFTRLQSIPENPDNSQAVAGVKKTALFDDLAEPLKLLLASLEPGKSGVRFDTGSEKFAVRLDSVSPATQSPGDLPDRELVKEILTEYKREQMLIRWLADLKSQAKITIHN
jgi:hypothetical protein